GNRDTNANDAMSYVTCDPRNASVHGASLSTGQVIFNSPLYTVGTRYVNATDSGHSIGSTQSNAVTVNPGGATHFSVSVPGSATAGSPFTFTVTALDFYNNTATGYTGTVHFTSSDGQAILPGDYAFVGGDAGVHTFSNGATLKTVGSRIITATDTVTGSITGTSATVAVSAAAATHYSVSAPGSATAGSAFTVTVTALDAFNNTATGYAGTVHFTSSDGAATLPADSTLVSGVKTFSSAVTLKTAGGQTVTATDTISNSITGTSNTVTVSAAAATHYSVSAPGSATAGNSFSFTVTALDAFNNTATGYAGTVHFTSSDGQAVLPANSTLTNGAGT